MLQKCLLVAVCLASAYLVVQAARSQHRTERVENPKLVVAQTERPLGTVSAGSVQRAEFTLYNAGSRRLIVREDVCSACDPGQWVIPPGQSRDLTIELDTTGLQGEVRHVRNYTTSDPLLPRLALAVSATVQRGITDEIQGQQASR
jgi:hypothetical protein